MSNMSQEEIDKLLNGAMEDNGIEQATDAKQEPEVPDQQPTELSSKPDTPADANNEEKVEAIEAGGDTQTAQVSEPAGKTDTPVSPEQQDGPEQTMQQMGEIRSIKAKEPNGAENMRRPSFDRKKEQRLGQGMHENIGMIIDMPLQVTVELGSAKMSIKDILAFTLGSIVELDRMAEELVDVKVNGKLIARGEIVVVDENYGVRITDIISPERRVKAY